MPGVFAAGNLVHAAETADVAAVGAMRTAGAVAAFLEAGTWPTRVPVVCAPPLRWVWPQAIDADAPAPGRFLLRTDAFADGAMLEATQDARVLWRGRRRTLVPNRSIGVPAAWSRTVDPGGGPIRFGVV
jgi:hypothetical protein